MVDAVDASKVLAEYAQVSANRPRSFDDREFKAADVDLNGKTDAVDASNILSYYAYLSASKENTKSLSEFLRGN